jgi:NADPH:quinone reductase-like Zn-dependent oxidoreductase
LITGAKISPKVSSIMTFIYAVNGYRPILAYWRTLSPNGLCVVAGGSIAQVLQAMLLGPLVSRIGGKKIVFQGNAATPAATPKEDLLVIKELLEAHKIVPVIGNCYPLNETVEAIRYLVKEHAQGKVIITMEK